jgi:hypothetical protein
MASGRKASKQVQPSVPDMVSESVHHTALPPQPEEENVASLKDDISQVSGDPIQQLFTTLGKFHRQLNKAQHAPDGEGWCDECMNELMAGLEISIAREWTPIKDALIDTARILHSYEQVGKAGLCVVFLKDSYELLSLMVGDLIVDTVRAGVKQKWREHYAKAVEELESRGIVLVEDEESEAMSSPPVKAAIVTKEFVAPAPAERKEAPAPTLSLEGAQSADTPEQASQKLAAELDDLAFDLPPLTEKSPEQAKEKGPETSGDILAFPGFSTQEETPFEEAPDHDILEEKDLLKFDGFEASAQESCPADADGKIENEAVAPEEKVEQEKEEQDITVQDDTEGKGQESADASPQEEAQPDSLPLEEPVQEVDENVVSPEPDATTAAKETPTPIQERKTARNADESHAALLQRVQAAITSGDTRNTKAMALELAVAMARMECEQARQDLAAAEQLLLENGRVIEQGQAKVAQMENDLLRAEELLAARDGERNANREQIGAIDEELSALSAELADIDAQIVALQQKRVEQENRIKNKKAEHEEAMDTESRTQTELEALAQEADSIRDNLENARNEVRHRNAERRAIELDIIKAQEEMEIRRLSLSTIENTLHPGSTPPTKESEGETLL